MRRFAAVYLTLAALSLVAAAPASAGRTETRTKADYIYLGSLGCWEQRTETVPLGPRVESVRVIRPTLGQAFFDRTWGDYVGRITIVYVDIRDSGTSVIFGGRGEGAACDPLSASTFPEQIAYLIRFRHRLLGRELGACGRVPMFRAKARVRANGSVSTCRGARALATAWRRQMNRRKRCFLSACKRGQRVHGWRCRAGSGSALWAKCRRRQEYVTWSWRR